jgi:WD40 repeat protein
VWPRKREGNAHTRLDAPAHDASRVAGHIGTVTAVAVRGDVVASGSFDKTAKIWDRSSVGVIIIYIYISSVSQSVSP